MILNRKQIIILAVVAVVMIIAILILIIAWPKKPGPSLTDLPVEPGLLVSETYNPETPKNAILTKPLINAPVGPGTDAELKTFELKMEKEKYQPSVITVNQGDTVTINFSTSEQTADIFLPDLGLYQTVQKGEIKLVVFQATTSGTFTFLCREACPANKVVKGTLIVLPRD